MISGLLLSALRDSGVATSAELQLRMAKSQATVSRLLHEADADIVRLARGRSARYAIPELIWGLPAQQPLYWDDHQRWGTLTFIVGNRVHIKTAKLDIVTQGELPWFLDHFRLQGFLGRAWARRLGFDANPESWSLAQILYANCQCAYDPPGAISIGEPGGEVVNSVSADQAVKAREYDRYAGDVATTLPAGSSAGGEQPKFLVVEDATGDSAATRRLIVKFSPPRTTPFGERWHDLLWAEAIALQVLSDHGFTVAETRVLQSERRTYLESVRFDRAGAHRKIHCVPLSAAHRGFVHGPRRNWAETCDVLTAQRRLPRADAVAVRVLMEYGRLIGNTDMHFGNLSLYAPDPATGRFTLAPAYDMLPMVYRPDMHQGEIAYTPLARSRPTTGHEAQWTQALAMALEFWSRIVAAPAVSAQLRDVAMQTRDAFVAQ